jgi:hypothetical protein
MPRLTGTLTNAASFAIDLNTLDKVVSQLALNNITFGNLTQGAIMSTPKFEQGSRPMDFLLFEEDHLHSRENITVEAADWGTVAANAEWVIKSGTVVSLKAGAKNIVKPYVKADGFYGVVVEEICAINKTDPGIRNRGVVIRRNATFKDAGLIFLAGDPLVNTPLSDADAADFEMKLQDNGCTLRHVVGETHYAGVSELG